jgi:hypothetical protein
MSSYTALEIKAALAAARAEPSYLGQCQALSWVARHVRGQQYVVSTATEAVKAALREDDDYNAVFPLAWPIRALLERDEVRTAKEVLQQALHKAKSITPASSQSEALFLIFQASMYGTERLWDATFKAVMASSLPAEHWRQRRNARDAICIAASADYHFAKQAATEMTDEKLSAAVLDLLSKGKKQTPRPFYW